MNQNFIAPEALDDTNEPVCRHCTKKFSIVEDKIKYYQGECPNCGLNPSALAVSTPKERPSGFRWIRDDRPSFTSYIRENTAREWIVNESTEELKPFNTYPSDS